MIDTPSLLLGPKVQGLFLRALEKAQSKGFGEEELLRALRSGDPWAHSFFRYALAQELSAYLAGICPGIRRVYVYGSTAENRAGPASDVDLILWIQKNPQRWKASFGGWMLFSFGAIARSPAFPHRGAFLISTSWMRDASKVGVTEARKLAS